LSGLPTISTTPVTSITRNSAVCGGTVTSTGGSPVTNRGICWKTTPNPTTSNNRTSDGNGTGTFTSKMSGLRTNTLYYVRAFATNSYGTVYGEQYSFTTMGYPKTDSIPAEALPNVYTMLLYPNPVSTTLNINYVLGEDADVEISGYNLTGVRLFELKKHLGAGSQTVSFDVSQLPNGFYVLTSRTDKNEVLTRKFIKVE
jgi:hypothetical protein